jgi:hypothetical protein
MTQSRKLVEKLAFAASFARFVNEQRIGIAEGIALIRLRETVARRFVVEHNREVSKATKLRTERLCVELVKLADRCGFRTCFSSGLYPQFYDRAGQLVCFPE